MQGRKRSWIIVYRLRTAGVKPRFIVITIAIRVRHARAASLGKKYSWTCVASFPRTWENMCRSRFASLKLQFSSGRGGSRILERGGTRTEATLSVMCVGGGGGGVGTQTRNQRNRETNANAKLATPFSGRPFVSCHTPKPASAAAMCSAF